MRRPLVVAVAALLSAAGAAVAPSPSWAGPAPELCIPDDSRGAVPASFVLEACVSATALVLRNDLDIPVRVAAAGNLDVPVVVQRAAGGPATVVRLAGGSGDVLMPGDVVRWPLGDGSAELTVSTLSPATVPAIVDTLRSLLPRTDAVDAAAVHAAFGTVVGTLASALDERADCAHGKNFLQVAACDLAVSPSISRSVVAQLPRDWVADVLPVVLDRTSWAEWADQQVLDAELLDGRTVTLSQAPKPSPALPPPPAHRAPPPAPRAAPAPAPAPAPVPVPPPVPGPVPAPALPAPAPAVPVPAPAPVAPPAVQDPGPAAADAARAAFEKWLAEVLEKARAHREGRGR